VSVNDVLDQQRHLNSSQKMQLRAVFQGFETLFDGKLKKYSGKKIRLELKDDAIPVHCKPFPVPQNMSKFLRRNANVCVKRM
jgi:hypothetical protein